MKTRLRNLQIVGMIAVLIAVLGCLAAVADLTTYKLRNLGSDYSNKEAARVETQFIEHRREVFKQVAGWIIIFIAGSLLVKRKENKGLFN